MPLYDKKIFFFNYARQWTHKIQPFRALCVTNRYLHVKCFERHLENMDNNI